MRKTILFLCTGDTCRGPMAAAFTAKLLEDAGIKGYEVRSAGVMTVHGFLATPESLQMLKNAGVELERHRSTPLTPEMLRKADLILGMTPLHVQHALREAPEIRGKVFLLKELARSDLKKVQIDDPMGNTLEVYKKVFSEIRSACQKLVKIPEITGKETPKASSARKKPARKPAARKSASKKSAKAKKTSSKKTSKKNATKKSSASKTAAKKSASRKSSSKKASARKPAAKKTGAKSTHRRKTTKTASSKATPKKRARSAAKKKSGR